VEAAKGIFAALAVPGGFGLFVATVPLAEPILLVLPFLLLIAAVAWLWKRAFPSL
jgi:hypothetical protein